MPSELIFWTSFHSSARLQARVEFGLSIDDSTKDEAKELDKIYMKIFKNNLGQMRARGFEWYHNNIRQLGNRELKYTIQREFLNQPGLFNQLRMREGVEAILGSMIMSTYAAFETMATDLWEAALNRNDDLANEYIKNIRKRRPLGMIYCDTDMI